MMRVFTFLTGCLLIPVFAGLFVVAGKAILCLAERHTFRWLDLDEIVLPAIAGFWYTVILAAVLVHSLRSAFVSFGHNLRELTVTSVILFYPLAVALVVALLGRSLGLTADVAMPLTAAAAIVAFFVGVGITQLFGPTAGKTHVRGRELSPVEVAAVRAAENLGNESAEVWWGGMQHPSRLASSHFCVVGGTGTGKTLTLRRFLLKILPGITTGSNQRALLYDAKRDLMPFLSGVNHLLERVRVLNPFDARSVAWDMAADINSPATAQQVASALIPTEEGPNRFFSDAGRAILTGVITAFIRSRPQQWTFRDVILTMQSEQRLRELLESTPATAPLVEEYFSKGQTFRNIRSTIASYMAGYQTVAALWSHATQRPPLSLTRWVREEETVLVLAGR